MSISICILKEIDGFLCEDTLHSIRLAASKADLHCIHLETEKYFNLFRQMDIEYLSGTLSEVNAEMLKSNFEAVDLQYINRDFEFAFRFLSQYFRLKENINDYLWVDHTDWCYSGKEMLWLSTQPYTSEWPYKKVSAV